MNPKYRVSPDVVFHLSADDEIQGAVAGAVASHSLDVHRLLLEFSKPSTIEEVHQRVETGLKIEELTQLLAMPIANGLLRDVEDGPPSPTPGPAPKVFGEALLQALLDEGPVRAAFRRGNACIIPNAFDAAFAESVASALDGVDDWATVEAMKAFGANRLHLISETIASPPPVEALREFLESSQVRERVAALSGRPCAGPLELSATLQLAGDYRLPGPADALPRRVSMVWYLTRRWAPEWGGHFLWLPSQTRIAPTFNTALLFDQSSTSDFFLCPTEVLAREKNLLLHWTWAQDEASRVDVPSSRAKEAWFAGPAPKHVAAGVFVTPE
jgi:hypothetical protein